MTQIFKLLIDWTVKVCIDDILVKSKIRTEHIQHLEKTFSFICKYNMKLNLIKCAFGVSVEKFLRFMVTQREIEVNPTLVKFVLRTHAPTNKKKMQGIIGRLVALDRFIAYFTDKLRFLFITL